MTFSNISYTFEKKMLTIMQELEFNKSVQRNNNYQALRTKI